MGTWNTFKSSYQQQGIFGDNNMFHESGFGAAWKVANPGIRRPMEGFGHAVKRGVVDSLIEKGNTGLINKGMTGEMVRYGGSIFSSGGLREVTHTAQQMGKSGRFMLGARRSAMGMLKTGAFKFLTPGLFLYNASQEGIGAATRDAVEQGAIWGAGRWALGRIGMGLASPAFLGAAAVVGTAIAAQKALVMGKKYGESVTKVSFGNAFNDTYGNAATMRQASLMAMQSSKINGRNALGHEASLMHCR